MIRRWLVAAALLAPAHVIEAKQIRSAAARDAFKHSSPCPATGSTHGACSGYVIDHIIPLACGGADRPSNMQWQTTAEAKAKDRWERIGCTPERAPRQTSR